MIKDDNASEQNLGPDEMARHGMPASRGRTTDMIQEFQVTPSTPQRKNLSINRSNTELQHMESS